MAKAADPAKALGAVLSALDPLEDADRQWVLQSAAARWQLAVANLDQASRVNGSSQPAVIANAALGRGAPQNAAAFFRDKNPKTDKQRVACLAYYLTHFKNTPEFKQTNIEQMKNEARAGNFNLKDALSNASKPSCGYLSLIGGGKKQLTSYGDEVVEALPDDAKVKELEKTYRASRHGRKRKGRSKKK